MQYLIYAIILILLFMLLQAIWPFLLALAIGYGVYRFIRYKMKEKYFQSPEFLDHKIKIDSTINDYNDIANYVKSIPNDNQFIPDNAKSKYSDLATFENTSRQDYKRDRNEKHLNSNNIYSASLQVVRNASEQPIKYLCKYFDIPANEESLNQLETIDTNISRMENTVNNLKAREKEI